MKTSPLTRLNRSGDGIPKVARAAFAPIDWPTRMRPCLRRSLVSSFAFSRASTEAVSVAIVDME